MKNRFITVLDVVCEHKIDRKVRIRYILYDNDRETDSSFVAIKSHCYKTRISALSHFFINQVDRYFGGPGLVVMAPAP